MLGSEYGWSKNDIYYHTYPDEFFKLQKVIKQRQAAEMYRQAIFAINPHVKDPKALLKVLERELKDADYVEQEKLDKASVDKLKGSIGANLGKGFGAITKDSD